MRWGARVAPPANAWRGYEGTVLLVEITRASITRILHMEVVYPDRGKDPVFQLTGDSSSDSDVPPESAKSSASSAVTSSVERTGG